MARVHPSSGKSTQLVAPLNESEIAVAKALTRLDDSWTVYIQPRIGFDVPSFVAVHDEHGVCAIEVADWHPDEYRRGDGGVEHRDDAGRWHPTSEHPRARARRDRSTLYDRFFAMPGDPGDPTAAVRAVVALPRFADDRAREVLTDAGVPAADDVDVWGESATTGEIEQIVRGSGAEAPPPSSMTRLRQHVVASEAVTDRPPAVRRTAGEHEIELNERDTRIRRVRGPAASGKSFGLTARAARLAAMGQRVLVLSFNVTLAHHLQALVTARCNEYGTSPTAVTCTNFHSLCTRVVQDAEQRGIDASPPRGARWADAIVAKAGQVLAAGAEHRYDAVLVDEGQEFRPEWWALLRDHVVEPDGEMLLAVDPMQDGDGRSAWVDETRIGGAGFVEPWIELGASLAMPPDLVPVVNAFARAHLDAGPDGMVPTPAADAGAPASTRRWLDAAKVADLGPLIGREVVRLLRENPTLAPSSVVFLCDYHHDGLAAVAEIEAAGYPVHHIFSRDPDDPRRRRRYRFWPGADAVKGTTIHGFKGLGASALVMGIGVEARSRQTAFVAMTRLRLHRADRSSFLSVVNADPRLTGFRTTFESWAPPPIDVAAG